MTQSVAQETIDTARMIGAQMAAQATTAEARERTVTQLARAIAQAQDSLTRALHFHVEAVVADDAQGIRQALYEAEAAQADLTVATATLVGFSLAA